MSRRMDREGVSRNPEDWSLKEVLRHPLAISQRTWHSQKLLYARAEIGVAVLYRQQGEAAMAEFCAHGGRMWLNMAIDERRVGLERIPH